MEILKFSEPPKRSGRAKNRSGLNGMVAFGIAVLVFGGMSTTLAGTITLNGAGGTVEFGQGVVTTAACDTSIKITPVSSYDTSTGFFVSAVKVEDIGIAASDTTSATERSAGCLGKYFTLKAYSATSTLRFDTTDQAAGGTAINSLVVQIPDSITVAGGAATGWTGKSRPNDGTTFSTIDTGGFLLNNSGEGTNAGRFTISGLKLNSSVVRFTLESSQ